MRVVAFVYYIEGLLTGGGYVRGLVFVVEVLLARTTMTDDNLHCLIMHIVTLLSPSVYLYAVDGHRRS